MEMRSPAVRSMSSSRAGGTRRHLMGEPLELVGRGPIADTTTSTSAPDRRVATMWSATALMRVGSATEVPPYFCTTRLTTTDGTGGPSADPGGSVPPHRREDSLDCATVSKASRRERQRQNREARRADEERASEAPEDDVAPGAARAPSSPSPRSSPSSSSGPNGSVQLVEHGDVPDGEEATGEEREAHGATGGIEPGGELRRDDETSCGTITLALDAQHYPKAVNNFVSLANQGFYDNMAFVRAAKNFVVQAGQPRPDQHHEQRRAGLQRPGGAPRRPRRRLGLPGRDRWRSPRPARIPPGTARRSSSSSPATRAPPADAHLRDLRERDEGAQRRAEDRGVRARQRRRAADDPGRDHQVGADHDAVRGDARPRRSTPPSS